MGDHNTQKMMTSNKTLLTVAIDDIIISEGQYFNIFPKTRFKKVLYLEIKVSKCYQLPNINLISYDILDEIHD